MIKQSTYRRLPWYTWAIALVAVAILVGVAMRFWNTFTPTQPAAPASAAAPSSAATQLSEGGQVTVKATWQGLSAGPVFAVAMDTHMVNLDGYDLKQLAMLRIDGGREVRPLWRIQARQAEANLAADKARRNWQSFVRQHDGQVVAYRSGRKRSM
jgi:hypothetical protein